MLFCTIFVSQYKQRRIDEKLYYDKRLEGAIQQLCYRCESCGGERIIIDVDRKICKNCGTLQPIQVCTKRY